MSEKALDAVADILRDTRRLLVVTGAGLSADSGVPTYRGVGGLYEDTVTEDGMPIEEALSGRTFRSEPALCWKYIGRIEEACRGARPNRAHEVIAALERRIERVCVLTQNVDGLHLEAGSHNVLEIHGTIRRLLCPGCGRRREIADFTSLAMPPHCGACGTIERPDVVLFGETLPVQVLEALQDELSAGVDAVMMVGTTAVFPYVAWPVQMAREADRPAIEVNPGTTDVSQACSHRLVMGAAEAFDLLARRLGL